MTQEDDVTQESEPWAETTEDQCDFVGTSADPEWPEWEYRCQLCSGHTGPCRTRGERR